MEDKDLDLSNVIVIRKTFLCTMPTPTPIPCPNTMLLPILINAEFIARAHPDSPSQAGISVVM